MNKMKKAYQQGGFLGQLQASGQMFGTQPIDYILNGTNYLANLFADNKNNSDAKQYQNYWQHQYQMPGMLSNPTQYGNPYAMQMGGIIDAMRKGGIHIKKENRGKFTEYCGGKVTAECIARAKRSSSATLRKRATFAANARKWNHQEGGEICLECMQDDFNPLGMSYLQVGGSVPTGGPVPGIGQEFYSDGNLEQDRIQQILSLSTQYGVPTNQIFTKGQRDLVTDAPDADLRYHEYQFINPKTNQWMTFRSPAKSKVKGNLAGTYAKKQLGGVIANTPEQQQAGYFAYPGASSIAFPGSGLRNFVPGPFPLGVQDKYGTQMLTNKPIKTIGNVTEYPLFKKGGEVTKQAKAVDEEDATIEAEKDEWILGIGAAKDPMAEDDSNIGVGLYKVGGNKHYNGGTKLNASPGDFVFSNDKDLAFSKDMASDLVGRTINKVRGRTPAKLAGTYGKLNDFIQMGQDPKEMELDRKTAILNTENILDKLADIAIGQEALKGFPNGIPIFAQASLAKRSTPNGGNPDQGMGQEQQTFQTGGMVMPWKSRQYQPVTRGYSTPNYEVIAPGEWYSVNGQRPQMATGLTNLNTNVRDDGYGFGRFMEFPLPPGMTPKVKDPYWWNMVQPTTPEGTFPLGGGEKVNPWDANGIDAALPQDFGPETPPTTAAGSTGSGGGSTGQSTPWAPLNIPNNYFGLGDPSQITAPAYDAPVQSTIKANIAQTQPTVGRNYNSPVNMNIAELYGLMAANKRYESRYPTAQRFYEGENIDALLSNSMKPLSATPYITNIQRQLNTFNANNSGYGPVSYARNSYAFTQALNASNQAVGQVEQQNIGRQDQQNAALAQNQALKGQYRLQLQDKYLRELETVKNNQENAAKARMAQTSNLLNAYTNRAYSQKYANAMLDNFQIDANGNIKAMPGNLKNQVLNSTGSNQMQSQLNYMEQLFRLMNRYGIKNGNFVDDFVKPITGGGR